MPHQSPPADAVLDAFPLSRLQSGMLFHSLYSAESATYHDLFSFHLRMRLDEGMLQAAIDEVVERHPVLRTSFDLGRLSEAVQIVHRSAAAPVGVADLRGLVPRDERAALESWMEQERRTSFELGTPPLFRLQVHRRSGETVQLSLSFHHAILDGRSVAVLLAELFAIYLARLAWSAPHLPPAPKLCMPRFVSLERDAVYSNEHRQFWAEQLHGAPASLVARPAQQADGLRRVTCREIDLPQPIAEALRWVARSAGVPLECALLAAHLRVLAALCGESDVVSGLVVDGRPEVSDAERALGLFLNTVPLRVRLPGGSWRDLVRAVYAAQAELLPFRRYPLAEIQREQGIGDLFDAVFLFGNFDILAAVTRGVVELLSARCLEETSFALAAHFLSQPDGVGLRLRLGCDAAALAITPESILGAYECTLSALAADPSARYDGLALAREAELQRVLVDCNRTQVMWSGPAEAHEAFAAQAAHVPDAVAVSADGGDLTYGELERRANQLAHHLRALGVGAETPVGVALERTPALLVALLGILKAGGAYVPLDPAHPATRLAYVLADTAAPLLVTDLPSQPWAARIPAVVRLDADRERIAERSGAAPAPVSSPQSLAYVLFTSGSTGSPKGVMVTRRSLANMLRAMACETGIGAGAVLAAVTTLSFDIAALELLLPLVVGARVDLVDRDTAADGPLLRRRLAEATMTQSTPSTWRLLLDAGWQGGNRFTALCGGEALPPEVAERLLATGAQVWNLYGPTETTVWSSAERLAGVEPIAIGRPLANTRLYVLDRWGQPVPAGVPGELYIGGDGVARGYLGRSDLTASRFVPDPFGPSGERLFRTGDRVRRCADGRLEFLGRLDRQLKIRGFRIEPAEIEAALCRHPGVAGAVVTASDGRLAAYVVTHTAAQAPPADLVAELRAALQTNLPTYMLPATFTFLADLPRLPNGKLDYRALPAPDPAAQARPYVTPRDPTEATIAAIWADLLGVARVGAQDDFFALGGDSLRCVQMIARLEATLGIQVPIRSVSRAPTVAALAAAVASEWRTALSVGRSESQRLREFLAQLSEEQIEALLADPLIASELPGDAAGWDREGSLP